MIINPFHSPLENQIFDSLTSPKLSDYILIDSFTFDISIQLCPSLVLVLLDNYNGNNLDQHKLLELPRRFTSIQILIIINLKFGYKYSLICQRLSNNSCNIRTSNEDVVRIIWKLK